MWKKITVVAGGMALAVALPFVALALTTDEFPDVLVPADTAAETLQATVGVQVADDVEVIEPTGPWVSPNAIDPITVQQNEQTMVRQQLRVHAETGPPEGFEPIQQRLHVDDPLGMGPGTEAPGQHMGNGNPNAPMAGTGDCTADGADCPNAGDPTAVTQNQNLNRHQNATQNKDMAMGNPDAPMAGAGTGDPADCPNDGQPVGGQGAGNGGRGRNNG